MALLPPSDPQAMLGCAEAFHLLNLTLDVYMSVSEANISTTRTEERRSQWKRGSGSAGTSTTTMSLMPCWRCSPSRRAKAGLRQYQLNSYFFSWCTSPRYRVARKNKTTSLDCSSEVDLYDSGIDCNQVTAARLADAISPPAANSDRQTNERTDKQKDITIA